MLVKHEIMNMKSNIHIVIILHIINYYQYCIDLNLIKRIT